MDLLFQRYASPFIFLDGMIRSGRFTEFVFEFVKTTNQDMEDKHQWEYFLHRVWDKSFQDFKEEIETNENNMNMNERTIETTIQHSINILNNFNPETQGGEN